jgi:glutaconate CoA-transferase, subunit A
MRSSSAAEQRAALDQRICAPWAAVSLSSTAVSEVPMGAHPTACYPFYAYDRRHTALYYEAAHKGAEAFKAEYLSVFVHGAPTHADYLDRIGGKKTRTRLSSWNQGDESWQRLYVEEAMV